MEVQIVSADSKVCLITGSSKGIGKAIACAFARKRYRVIVNYDVDDAAAEQTMSELAAFGSDFMVQRADVSRPDQVAEMFNAVREKFGGLHVLVNNAGITRDRSFRKMTKQEWDEVVGVNLTGVFNCTKEAVELMLLNNWGRIINISSVVGQVGNFGQVNYAAAKAGIIGFTKALARELVSKNITVNAIAPGFINTDMTKGIPPEVREKICDRILFGRFGDPEDVANLVMLLASDEASYLTGQVFNVDGGYFG